MGNYYTKRKVKPNQLATTICLVVFAHSIFGQSNQTPVVKGGGFLYFLEHQFNGYSLHLEYEKVFRHAPFFTSGLRIDYTQFKNSTGAPMIGYDIKVYPFYGLSKRRLYHGIFTGVDLAYLIQTKSSKDSRYGPGLGMLLGYQHILKDRISLSLEGVMIYVQDLSEKSIQHNPERRYLYVFANLKVGLKIRRKTTPQ